MPQSQKKQALLGIFYMAAAVFFFACMDTLIKGLSKEYTPFQILFFRSFFSFIPLAFFIFSTGGISNLRTNIAHKHLIRSAVGMISMTAFIYSVARIPFANLYAIEFTGPIFMTLLSYFLLHEQVTKHHWSAIFIGFLGVIIIIRPGTDMFEIASLVALTGSFLFALMAIQIRQFSKTQKPQTITFYYTLGCLLISGFIVLFEWRTPDMDELFMLIGIGILSGITQILITKGVSLAPVSLIAPLEYSGIIWAATFGYLFFNEVPDMYLYIGGTIVIAAGLYMTYYSQKDH